MRPGANILPWATSIVLFLGLVGAIWWGVGQRDERDAATDELERLRGQVVEESSQTNAIAYRLAVTPNGPANASGTAFMPLSGSGMLSVVNLPAPLDGQIYQLWYFQDDSTPPIAGGSFEVDAQGVGFMLIPADVGTFRSVGVSLEPDGGSASPTTPMILQGSVGAARG
jgi:hypothetical protein